VKLLTPEPKAKAEAPIDAETKACESPSRTCTRGASEEACHRRQHQTRHAGTNLNNHGVGVEHYCVDRPPRPEVTNGEGDGAEPGRRQQHKLTLGGTDPFG
jgi:hypothetical protein